MSTRRVKAYLDIEPKNFPRLLARAWAIYNAMNADPARYGAATVAMAALLALITTLETAQKDTSPGAHAAGGVRDLAGGALVVALQKELAFVQGLADTTPVEAVVIIQGAAMKVTPVGVRHIPIVDGEPGPQSGTLFATANTAVLTAGLGGGAVTYHWRTSANGGVTYVQAPSTPIHTTTITGLTPTTNYLVEVAVTVGDHPQGPWSNAAHVLVA